MKVEMELELKDVPGSLLKALEPISMHGGNIKSVLHYRSERDLVKVKIVFEIKDRMSFDLIQKALKERRIHISRITIEGRKYYEKKTISFILIGHVIDTDIRDTIDNINEIGCVSDVDIIMPDPNERSSVLMKADIDNEKMDKTISIIESICKNKNLILIRSLYS
ncbi:MAG: hypothetical protein DRO92_03270 [Candidatus Altiarchaeales archaeon]|nr:MAG: hypothetical protein DRO92_03270 [Candidatus Altiarchaeales archaeon]